MTLSASIINNQSARKPKQGKPWVVVHFIHTVPTDWSRISFREYTTTLAEPTY